MFLLLSFLTLLPTDKRNGDKGLGKRKGNATSTRGSEDPVAPDHNSERKGQKQQNAREYVRMLFCLAVLCRWEELITEGVDDRDRVSGRDKKVSDEMSMGSFPKF